MEISNRFVVCFFFKDEVDETVITLHPEESKDKY